MVSAGAPDSGISIFGLDVPLPTASVVAAGTDVTALTTAGCAVPLLDPPEPPLLASFTPIRTATTASTARTLPPAIRVCRRRWARRSAARCAAIFSRAFCCRIRCALLMTVLPSHR